MPQTQSIQYGEQARASIKAGIDKAADAIKVTLGPVGKTMVIDLGQANPRITDDGVTGARVIRLKDPHEDVGAKFIREIANKADDHAGDGTTTATVLAQAMTEEAFKLLDANPESVATVKRELNAAVEDAKAQLDAMARPVKTKEEIRQVAYVSSLDEEVADAIAEAFDTLGHSATVIVDSNTQPGIKLKTVKGMRLAKGVLSDWFITNAERIEARLENPRVLVTDKRIASGEQMGAFLENLIKAKILSFVLVADDISGEALATLLVNMQKGLYNCIAITAPYHNERRQQAYEDIAALAGTHVVSDSLGQTLADIKPENLGSFESVISNRSVTTFVGGKGDVTERVAAMEAEKAEATNAYDRDTLSERISGLTGGIGVISVGDFSESAALTRRQKVEDSLNSTKAAIEEGIVPGGGAALSCIKTDNLILRQCKFAPLMQMATNAGMSNTDIVLSLQNATDADPDHDSSCIDFNTGKIVDAFEAGIVDPVKVVKSSLAAAASVVSNALSVGTLIVELPEEPKK